MIKKNCEPIRSLGANRPSVDRVRTGIKRRRPCTGQSITIARLDTVRRGVEDASGHVRSWYHQRRDAVDKQRNPVIVFTVESWIIIPVAIGVIVIVIAGLVIQGVRTGWFTAGPRGEVLWTLVWRFCRVFSRVVHRVEYTGLEHVPDTNDAGPILVVSNHTAALDPIIIQSACPVHIRWMMAEEYGSDEYAWFWNWLGIISVRRDGRDSAAARTALRHLKQGGAIGLFPEGGIENPAEQLRPFMDGLTMFIARSSAPVLLVWVRDTPKTGSVISSLLQPSRSKVTFLGMYNFADEEDTSTIADDLRNKLAAASGWPLRDDPLPSAIQAGNAHRTGPQE